MTNERLSKLLNDPSEKAKEGNKKAKQFLRGTGALRDHKGNYTISEADIYEWFQAEADKNCESGYDNEIVDIRNGLYKRILNRGK